MAYSMDQFNEELMHYGVLGMRWGHRKDRPTSGGIAGAIRRKQRSNAQNDLAKVKSQQKTVDSELRELRGYEKNPSKIGKSKISTAIRKRQIKSFEKENLDALKELDQIERYRAKRAAIKAQKKMSKVKIKDLQKQYGMLEDQMTYGKNADPVKNSRIESQMNSIEEQLHKHRGGESVSNK